MLFWSYIVSVDVCVEGILLPSLLPSIYSFFFLEHVKQVTVFLDVFIGYVRRLLPRRQKTLIRETELTFRCRGPRCLTGKLRTWRHGVCVHV